MFVVGLTGGIASGKSTVARLLRERGVPVVDADQLSRDAVAPGTPALERIRHRWPGVIRPDGTLDRAALGRLVFADPEQRRELTSIVIPEVGRLFLERAQALENSGARFVVFEAATLFEERMEGMTHGVLLVRIPADEQVKRVMKRNGYTEQEARARLAAQLPLEEKQKRARWVLDNSGSELELKARVDAAWQAIVADLERSET